MFRSVLLHKDRSLYKLNLNPFQLPLVMLRRDLLLLKNVSFYKLNLDCHSLLLRLL